MKWMLGPFTKLDSANPVLEPNHEATWTCPMASEVCWEAKDVFNPAAAVVDGQINLLYRAEDTVGKHLGTSRIGLARSSDGTTFHREPTPVFYPDRDDFHHLEWEGGCEDPRVVRSPDGQFVMTYTAFDGLKARLCVATSKNLTTWEKHGLAFPDMPELWCKAGSIVCKVTGDDLMATKVRGKYWMYFGESSIFVATSDDLIHWKPVRNACDKPIFPVGYMPMAPVIPSAFSLESVGKSVPESEALYACMRPRTGRFDSEIIEPGPPAILTEDGVVLLYHGRNSATHGDAQIPPSTYCVAQALFDRLDPTALIARATEPSLKPEKDYEITGQVGNVCFAEGLVPFKGKWWLYYGTADSRIAVATAPMVQPA